MLVADKSSVLRVQKAFIELAQSISNPEELLQDVANKSVYPAVAEIFDNEGYGAWAALTPAYALDKFNEFGEVPILERTGALRASLTMANAPDSINSYDSDGSLIIGSKLPYFGVNNELRPIAQFQEGHIQSMLDTATEHMAQVALDEGFEVIEG